MRPVISPQASQPADSTPPASPNPDTVHNDVRGLQRFMSFVPGGCFREITYGIQELRGQGAQGMSEHHVWDGIVDITKGVVATGEFFSRWPIYLTASLGLFHVATPAIVAALLPAATIIAGASGLFGTALDGGRDMVFGIKDHNPREAAWGAAKTMAGMIGTYGLVTLNPVLIAGGPVLYLGVVAAQNWKGVKAAIHMGWDKVFHHGAAPDKNRVPASP